MCVCVCTVWVMFQQQHQLCVYYQAKKVCGNYLLLFLNGRARFPHHKRILYRINAHLSINTADLRL